MKTKSDVLIFIILLSLNRTGLPNCLNQSCTLVIWGSIAVPWLKKWEDFVRVTKEVKIMIWHYGFRNKLNKFIIFLKFCTTGEIMPGPLPEDSPRNLTWLKVHKRRFKIT